MMPTFKEALKQALEIQVEEARCTLPVIPEILRGNIVGGIEQATRCKLLSLKDRTNRDKYAPEGVKRAVSKIVDTVIYVGDRIMPVPPEKGPPLPYIFKLNWPGKGG